jgi:hypothetical protein
MGSRGKYAGRPHSVRCPKCRRGKFGYRPQIAGVKVTWEQKPNPRPQHPHAHTLTRIVCLDCEHEWWTTLLGARRDKLKEGGGA